MCRNIKPLFNFDPPATDEEIQAAALQFVRKLRAEFFEKKAEKEKQAAESVPAVGMGSEQELTT